MKFLTRDEPGITHHKVLIYGQPGTGKTSFGVSAPGPVLHVLTERNGLANIKAAAARLNITCPEVLFIESKEELRAVVNALHADPAKPFTIAKRELERPRTVVIDQVSDIMRMISGEHDKEYKPKPGSDGLPVRAMNSWNLLADTCRGVIRGFRDAPCHTVFLAELTDKEVGDEGARRRFFGPAMPMSQLVPALVHSASIVGISYKTVTDRKDKDTKQRVVEWGIQTVGPEWKITKGLSPLNDFEVSDFSSWVRRLDGAVEKVRFPEMPEDIKGSPDVIEASGVEAKNGKEKDDGIQT